MWIDTRRDRSDWRHGGGWSVATKRRQYHSTNGAVVPAENVSQVEWEAAVVLTKFFAHSFRTKCISENHQRNFIAWYYLVLDAVTLKKAAYRIAGPHSFWNSGIVICAYRRGSIGGHNHQQVCVCEFRCPSSVWKEWLNVIERNHRLDQMCLSYWRCLCPRIDFYPSSECEKCHFLTFQDYDMRKICLNLLLHFKLLVVGAQYGGFWNEFLFKISRHSLTRCFWLINLHISVPWFISQQSTGEVLNFGSTPALFPFSW